MNGTYTKEPTDVVIQEMSMSILSNHVITLFKDNVPRILIQGEDYQVVVSEAAEQGYEYTYKIFAENFVADGVYEITVESKDEAGNLVGYNHGENKGKINFAVDQTLPLINVENLESNTTYGTDHLNVHMSVEDNLMLTKVMVFLDGKEHRTWTKKELDKIVKSGGNFSFEIVGNSTDPHNMIVCAQDAAGNGEAMINMQELPYNAVVVENFYVTRNMWVRYYTNKPLFYGSVGCLLLIGGFIIYYILNKRKTK